MDIINFRFLLSGLIAALPTAMSLILVALSAFPRGRAGYIKNTDIYKKSLSGAIILIGMFTISILLNFISLLTLDIIFTSGDFFVLYIGLLLSVVSFTFMPIFLLWYLVKTANL